MRYDPKIGEPIELEAATIEIEESSGPVKGEHVRYDEKGGIEYLTTYYLVRVRVTFTL
jgi:hypothetical protein